MRILWKVPLTRTTNTKHAKDRILDTNWRNNHSARVGKCLRIAGILLGVFDDIYFLRLEYIGTGRGRPSRSNGKCLRSTAEDLLRSTMVPRLTGCFKEVEMFFL